MHSLSSLFKNMTQEPASSLEERVLQALTSEQLLAFRRKNILASLGILLSGACVLLTTFFLGSALLQSEFWSLFTLLFSDMRVVISTSQDFFYSLLETLPLLPLIALFVPLTAFFFSLSFFLSLGEKVSVSGFSHRALHV